MNYYFMISIGDWAKSPISNPQPPILIILNLLNIIFNFYINLILYTFLAFNLNIYKLNLLINNLMYKDKEFEENKKIKRTFLIYLIWKHSTIFEFILYIIGILACVYIGYAFIQFSDYLGEFVNIFSKGINDSNDVKYEKTKDLIKEVILLGLKELVCQYLFFATHDYVGLKVYNRIRLSYMKILFTMEQKWFDNNHIIYNEISTKIINETNIIKGTITTSFGNFVTNISRILYSLYYTFKFNTSLGLYCLLFLALKIILILLSGWLLSDINKKKKVFNNKLGGYLTDVLRNIKIVSANCNYNYENKEFQKKIKSVENEENSFALKITIVNSITFFLVYFSYIYNYIVGNIIYNKKKEGETFNQGDLINAMGKIYAVEGEFQEVVPNIRLLIECEVITGFYMDLFNFYIKKNNLTKQQINEDLIFKDYNINENIKSKLLNLKGKFLNDNVSFKYNDNEKNEYLQSEIITLNENLNKDFKNNKFKNFVFENLNLTFEENKTTAIFGPSGCGKSTLIKLIIRLYDLDANNGQILVDNILNLHWLKYDISNKIKLTLKNYRNNIGYVEQRPILLNDTIRNNILVGRSHISDEIIWEKLKLLKLDKFIKSLDEQLDYIVGEKGNKLSGGQKQRIVIARALVDDPNILIFDEATSSLDEDNVIRINNIINSLKGSKTIIIATHDLRLLKDVDKIIILNDKGSILEQGTPEGLIKNNGIYLKELKDRFLENEKMTTQEMDENLNYNNNVNNIKNIRKNKNDKELRGFISSLFQNKLFFSLSIFFMLSCGLLIPYGNDYCYKFFADSYLPDIEEFKKENKKHSSIAAIIYTAAIICYFIQYYFTEKLGIKLSTQNKGNIFSHLIKMNVGFFDNSENAPTKLSDFIISETSNINSSFLHLLLFIELFIALFISGSIIAGSYSSQMVLIALAILALILILNIFFLYLNSKEEELTKDKLYGEILTDNLNNLISLHANSYDDFMLKKINEEIKNKEFKKFLYSNLNAFFYGLMLFIFNCFASLEFYISYKLIIDNKLSVNNFVNSFKSVINNVSNIIRTFKFFKNITTIKESLKKLSYLNNIKSEIDYKECTNESMVEYRDSTKGKINFENVSFSYPENLNQIVLNSINFEINPSEKICIIGESGCGKSTIPQLIERFYEPYEGEVKIDGNNIKNIEIKKLRNIISYVQQEENLFNRSIYDNIKYSNLNATDDEINNVIKLCGLEEIISINESKERDNKKENEELSGGQIQKICIARAILKNPKILILDECTSGLDNKSEKEIQDTIDNITQKYNITTIIITHKKSFIKKCNRCLLIKNGKIWKSLEKEQILKLFN